MNWVDWVYLPPLLALVPAWLLLTGFRCYVTAWALMIILRGLAGFAVIAYAASGDYPSTWAAAGMGGVTLLARCLFNPEGPRDRLVPGRRRVQVTTRER